ncbi:hypothetical protein Hamer_G028163 [Homarus americanus]|uniref:Uncharacterized protein n=1 Tax=Homarus americanus TaxID=6706 RepID=A0A8J5MNR6_HOMAM|nr:hypothetical protein Hamer_G028163 [Homarus americanus]
MDEDKFADNTNKKYWNWRMLFQQPTLTLGEIDPELLSVNIKHWMSVTNPRFDRNFLHAGRKQQQQKQQNKCGDSWTFEDGLLIMGMGYLMGYLFNSVLLMSVIIAIMIIAHSVIKRRSITVNSIKQDSLPDNDTLASSETPPPSYFELKIDDQNYCDYNSSSITSTLTTPPSSYPLAAI